MMLLSLILFTLMTTCLASGFPQGCHDYGIDVSLPSKVYTIYQGPYAVATKVYCDMETDKGGWTVFQRRYSGFYHFYRPWEDYRNGFGDPETEYWLGLEKLRVLTQSGKFELRVVLEDFEGKKVYAHYDSFSIDEECDGYALHVSGFKDGGAGDSLTYHDGQKFSTFDKDQDSSNSHCAKHFHGGFWYNSCYHTNINGIYEWGQVYYYYSSGMIWASFRGYSYSLKSTVMMVRRVE